MLTSFGGQSPAKMAGFFADGSTPLSVSCNIAIRGWRGGSEVMSFYMAVFFADTGLNFWSECIGGESLQRAGLPGSACRRRNVVSTLGLVHVDSVGLGLARRGSVRFCLIPNLGYGGQPSDGVRCSPKIVSMCGESVFSDAI